MRHKFNTCCNSKCVFLSFGKNTGSIPHTWVIAGICVAAIGAVYFSCVQLRLGALFVWGDNMNENDVRLPDSVADITGAILTPGKPDECQGNGKNPDFEICCDECDYFTLSFNSS